MTAPGVPHADRIALDRQYFLDRVKVDRNGCWIWQLHINSKGYGEASERRTRIAAHRLSYKVLVAPIPAGMTIDHMCNVTACVNPEHLQMLDRTSHLKLEHTRGKYKNHLMQLNQGVAI